MFARLPDQPKNHLRESEIAAFHRDGAILIKDAVGDELVASIDAAVERIRKAPPTELAQATQLLGAAFAGDAFMWKVDDFFRDLVYFSPFPRLSQQLFSSRSVRAFYDQIFVKEPGVGISTPWHEDVSSWPINGYQVCSFWMTLDACGPDNGALRVARGSHRFVESFRPVTPGWADSDERNDFDELPTIANDEILSWEMQPGDIVLFHPKALHSAVYAGGKRRRRAFVSRWLGDGVEYTPQYAVLPLLWNHGLSAGDPIGGPLFPQVLPSTIDWEGETRWNGPEQPDNEAMEQFLTILKHR